ncbi:MULTISPECIES: outer membrane beta-barrel protein [Sphingobacterium]|uniref:Outer membrane beta-barrel protein n=1 Tax=Sphingobacterium populi TaxID=1812824 RepID=A0ABW5UD79_9SPHI|nr:outer membrane beta-barrel protein [Sphingobacterium sp. CFCC 11742]
MLRLPQSIFQKNTRIAILAIALLFTSLHAKAQYGGYPYERNMRLGLVINPNISWFNFDSSHSSGNPGYRFGYGLLADFGFSRNYYFSTGLIINDLRAEQVQLFEGGTPATVNNSIRLKYAEVPLTIKLKTEDRDFGRIYGQFGVTTGIRVSARQQNDLPNAETQSLSGTDLVRLGLQIGTGVEWNLGGNLGLLTGAAYNNGFTRAMRNGGEPKISYVALQVGLLF